MKKISILSIILIALLHLQCTETPRGKKALYIIGDSTVKNGKGTGTSGLWGWGSFLNQYFDTTKISVQNDALGGTSSRTFRSKGNWFGILDSLKEGDYVLIQFGHNDSGAINDTIRARGTLKGIGDETEEIDNLITGEFEIVHTYGWYLRKYISEIKSKGANPVIISPIPRNKWENGKVIRNTNDYGLWAKQVAEAENIPFIDLNEKMAMAMEQLGENNMTGNYFYGHDHTHTTAKAAALNASFVADAIKTQKIQGLSKYLLKSPQTKLPAKKRVFIIGDSTVESNGKNSIVGWGKCLPDFLDTLRLEFHNYARGGRSSRTFRSEGLWQVVESQLQPGDIVLIQFGHNDGGKIDEGKRRASLQGNGDQSEMSVMPDGKKEVVHTYGWYLRKYVYESHKRKAIAIVFSPVPRNEWKNNVVERVNETYGTWAREASEQEGAIYVDLNNAVAQKYETMGKLAVKPFFPNDHTHTNYDGAALNAQTIAELMAADKKGPLADYVLKK